MVGFSEPPLGVDPSDVEGSTTERPATGPVRWLVLLMTGVGVTGGALALYHRPSGRGFWAGTHAARLGVHVQLERVLAWGHRVGAALLLLGTALWLYRTWRREGSSRSLGPMGWALVALAATLTALLVPWHQFLPWSDVATINDLEPARLGDDEGPFPELTAVRAHYPVGAADLAWPPNLRSRRAGVLAWVHVLVGPLGALAALFVRRVSRVRYSKDG